MKHHALERRLRTQESTVSHWQLLLDGMTRAAIRHATADMREIHDGVWVAGHGTLTDRQRWWAAVLTAPTTALAAASAGGLHGFYERRSFGEVVVRPGSGGPKQFGRLLVCRSARLDGDVRRYHGIPATTPARTVLDLVACTPAYAADRIVRDALRTGAVDGPALLMIAGRHRGCRGVVRLRRLTHRYGRLPARRAKSDAELLALAILQAADVPPPELNVVRAGHEADLSWPALRRIIELDSRGYHPFACRDADIQRDWERAGWHVDRLPTDDVYDRPDKLLALAPKPRRRPSGRLWSP